MSRVIFINPPDHSVDGPHVTKDMAGGYGFDAGPRVVLPPLELIYHAQTVRDAGHEIVFFDLQAVPGGDLERELSSGTPPVVIVQLTPASIDTDIGFVKRLGAMRADAVILATYSRNDKVELSRILKCGTVHRVLYGETELEIGKILAGRSSRGSAWLEEGALCLGGDLRVDDLAGLPLLDPGFLDIAPYRFPMAGAGERFFTLQSSRGCPFSCGYYCPYPLIQGTTWRAMTAEQVVENLVHLHDRLGVDAVLFRDATFTLDQKRVRKICDGILAKRLHLHWWCETRVNCVDEETMAAMVRAGCVGISVGVETGDDELMRSVAKPGTSMARLAAFRDIAKRLGLRVHFLMMVGLPDETRTSLYRSVTMINTLRPESLGVTAITPYPGTPLHAEALEKGWIVDPEAGRYVGTRIVMRSRNLSAREIQVGFLGLRLVAWLERKKPPLFRLAQKLVRIGFWIGSAWGNSAAR